MNSESEIIRIKQFANGNKEVGFFPKKSEFGIKNVFKNSLNTFFEATKHWTFQEDLAKKKKEEFQIKSFSFGRMNDLFFSSNRCKFGPKYVKIKWVFCVLNQKKLNIFVKFGQKNHDVSEILDQKCLKQKLETKKVRFKLCKNMKTNRNVFFATKASNITRIWQNKKRISNLCHLAEFFVFCRFVLEKKKKNVNQSFCRFVFS